MINKANKVMMAAEENEKLKGFWARLRLRSTFLHLGLVATCITYIVLGAYMFRAIERPIELKLRKEAIYEFEKLKTNLLTNVSYDDSAVDELIDSYMERLFELFENPHYAHVFESQTNYSTGIDLWTFSSAVLFTTTTVIPVGYGYICPVSDVGKLLLIIYGIVGIPLALVTMADTGKFISQFVIRCFSESMTIPTVLFLSLLFFYPIIGGLLFHYYSDISVLDAIYFSLTSIFTIGFGDLMPNINIIHLVVFIVFGVILVTITIDFIAAELIDHIHYMGRHVGKAKQIAGKMLQIAQSLHMNRGISGLTAGMNQLQALARAGLLGKLDKEVLEKGRQMACAFAPVLDDMDFMDNASIYNSKMDLRSSPRAKSKMGLVR